MEKDENEKWMEDLISSPESFFSQMEARGVDFSKVNFDAKSLVKNKFGLNENQFKAVEFVYWASYFIERIISEAVSESEKKRGASIMIDKMLDQLSFGNKISLVSGGKGMKDLINMAWKINDLRNHVAHGRLDKLKYSGFELSTAKGQLKLMVDLLRSTNSEPES